MGVPAQFSVLEVKQKGQAQGQRVIFTSNWFVATQDGTSTLLQFITVYRDWYRAFLLPLLHNGYTVNSFVARRIASIKSLPPPAGSPAGTQPTLVFRYNDFSILDGDPVDDKGTGLDPGMPTFVGVGFPKVVGVTRTIRNQEVTGGSKMLKGSGRFGPILEADTVVGTPNVLTTPFIEDVQDALDDRRILQFGAGGSAQECVVSMSQDGLPWSFGDPPVIEPVIAVVEGYDVNAFVTSQVSRKQSLNTLG